ncbi:hypothetical protein L208DRAFT_1248962 [Tricholoma matsutake]|nr:hypothetical protein L208DRAFT_1248962 [Tricholoma matsutake 945]
MASHPIHDHLNEVPSQIENMDIESELDDEVDQLDSESDADVSELDMSMKNGTGSGGQRMPGHSLIPALRLENIIQADGVAGNLAVSKEGLFILSIATEEFIKRMAEAGHLQASSERRTSINYRDMAATTQQYQEFMFLNDTIPAPVPLAEALAMRDAKERELDPAMSTSLSVHPTSASAPIANTQKNRGKSRNVNGPEWRNGKWADGHNSSRYGLEHARPSHINGVVSVSTHVPPPSNGHSTAPSRSGTITPARSREEAFGSRSPPRHFPDSHNSPLLAQEESWTGQYTGPASGFLQGPGGPFGRVAQNPGRTIYSQQHRTD